MSESRELWIVFGGAALAILALLGWYWWLDHLRQRKLQQRLQDPPIDLTGASGPTAPIMDYVKQDYVEQPYVWKDGDYQGTIQWITGPSEPSSKTRDYHRPP